MKMLIALIALTLGMTFAAGIATASSAEEGTQQEEMMKTRKVVVEGTEKAKEGEEALKEEHMMKEGETLLKEEAATEEGHKAAEEAK